ncbi:MAG: bifunctional precorrin-2 dehydrogenase/sirohydrochlorin ferrochelatase, partial [Nitrospirales bacterium]|nr:bifunctional precorrin-2 dehydrogenase/sirohydrochlorin ferrochelatase [Nitrospirales bacterium]
HRERGYRKGDLRSAFLAIAATSDEKVNRRVSEDAPCLVNVADSPDLANFIVPALIRRSPLSIAVSTSGASPAVARTIRKELETLYPKETGRFLELLRSIRIRALQEIKDRSAREDLLRWAGSPESLGLFRERGLGEVRTMIHERFLSLKEGRS